MPIPDFRMTVTTSWKRPFRGHSIMTSYLGVNQPLIVTHKRWSRGYFWPFFIMHQNDPLVCMIQNNCWCFLSGFYHFQQSMVDDQGWMVGSNEKGCKMGVDCRPDRKEQEGRRRPRKVLGSYAPRYTVLPISWNYCIIKNVSKNIWIRIGVR